MYVDGLHPLPQKVPFGTVLLRIPALSLQHEVRAALQPDEKSRAVFADHAAIDIQHLEAEVLILYPGFYRRVMVKGEGRRLPDVLHHLSPQGDDEAALQAGAAADYGVSEGGKAREGPGRPPLPPRQEQPHEDPGQALTPGFRLSGRCQALRP